jgi:alkyl sulfatase BDS1-like metallo-beta-lactamase superfamily hydrolase
MGESAMMDANDDDLPLSKIIRPPDDAELPKEIAPGVFMSEDVSNSYAIRTNEGAVIINTGTVADGPKHLARYRKAGAGALRYVILTQHHADHRGGLQAFLAQHDRPKVITDWRFPEGYKYNTELQAFFLPKWERIWRIVLGDNLPTSPYFPIVPDILVEWNYGFDLGGRRFELFSVPGGETLDSLCVWLPKEKIVFTGNLFGPAFMTVPNVNTLRMDKPRSILEYIRNADRVLKLGAEMLVTGHGEPIRGAENVATSVRKLRDAVQYIHDETARRMNAGQKLEQMMREITLPPELQLHEWYGTVPWTVKTLWAEYVGWWEQDFTSRLYPVALSDRYSELVALAGADALAHKAREHLDAGRAVEALQLVEILLFAKADHRQGLAVMIGALQSPLKGAAVKRNLQETIWLRSEIARVTAQLQQA